MQAHIHSHSLAQPPLAQRASAHARSCAVTPAQCSRVQSSHGCSSSYSTCLSLAALSTRPTKSGRRRGCPTVLRAVSPTSKNWAGGGEAELGAGAQSLQASNTRRLKMLIAYDGTEFSGFQFQPKVRTVQGELERAAKRLFLGSSRIVGASRTDAGAHANGQVAHFDVHGERDSLATDLMMFNGFLPEDVKVLDLTYAEPGFESQYWSLGKTYSYRINTGVPHPMQSRYSWWIFDRYCTQSRGKPLSPTDLHLNVEAMREAASMLQGLHDCSALMDVKRGQGLGNFKRTKPHLAAKGIRPVRTSEKNMRTLGEVSIHEERHPLTGGQEISIIITGEGFLYHMVRVIAAVLVEVGHGRLTKEKMMKAVQSASRDIFPEAAPPHGLYLERVWYPNTKADMLDRCGSPEARELLAVAVSNKGPERGRKHSATEEGFVDGSEGGGQTEGVSPGGSSSSSSSSSSNGRSSSSNSSGNSSHYESQGLAALRRSSSSVISSVQSESDDDGDGPA